MKAPNTPKSTTSMKDSILQLMDPKVENEKEAFQQRTSNLKSLKNTNKCVGLFFFSLSLIFTIDYFLSLEESFEVPQSCFEKGECEIDALVPSHRGPQFLYLEFQGFHQNYKDYMESLEQRQFYA